MTRAIFALYKQAHMCTGMSTSAVSAFLSTPVLLIICILSTENVCNIYIICIKYTLDVTYIMCVCALVHVCVCVCVCVSVCVCVIVCVHVCI